MNHSKEQVNFKFSFENKILLIKATIFGNLNFPDCFKLFVIDMTTNQYSAFSIYFNEIENKKLLLCKRLPRELLRLNTTELKEQLWLEIILEFNCGL